MATKENKRRVRMMVEELEQRIHRGPAIHTAEIESAQDFLRQNEFSPASDYFNRLADLEKRLRGRVRIVSPPAKRNYGGRAAGRQMQLQSIYDHVILSICYRGDFNTQTGRIKISHRFNQEGRIDFVELKFLESLCPPLNGEVRKLLAVRDYPSIRKDWYEATAHALRVLPQELVFLYENIFECPREQVFAWLINIGHGIAADLLQELQTSRGGYSGPPRAATGEGWQDFNRAAGSDPGWVPATWNSRNGGGKTVCLERGRRENGFIAADGNGGPSPRSNRYPDQLPLEALMQDEVALPILEKSAGLGTTVEMENPEAILVRYKTS